MSVVEEETSRAPGAPDTTFIDRYFNNWRVVALAGLATAFSLAVLGKPPIGVAGGVEFSDPFGKMQRTVTVFAHTAELRHLNWEAVPSDVTNRLRERGSLRFQAGNASYTLLLGKMDSKGLANPTLSFYGMVGLPSDRG